MDATDQPQDRTPGPPSPTRRAILVALGLAAFWTLLNEGDASSWVVGAPTVALGIWLTSLRPPGPRLAVSPLGAVRLVPYFLRASLAGGWDVVIRALRPSLPIAPGFVEYEADLPPGPARVVFLNTLSLMPGTLTCRFDGARCLVHVIDGRAAPEKGLRALEGRVARAFPPRPEAP